MRPSTEPRPWPTFSTVPTGLVTALCTSWIGAEAALTSESWNAWLFCTSCSAAIACSSFTRTPSMFTPTTEKLPNFDSMTKRPKLPSSATGSATVCSGPFSSAEGASSAPASTGAASKPPLGCAIAGVVATRATAASRQARAGAARCFKDAGFIVSFMKD